MRADTGILYVLVTRNNLFLTITDVTGAHTLYRTTGGQVAKNSRDKNSIFTINAMIREICRYLLTNRIENLEIRTCIRGRGGHQPISTFSPNTTNIRRGLQRAGIRIFNEEIVTPVPTDRVKPKYGRRGRRV
jgi:small subunit ribosomal protein S11